MFHCLPSRRELPVWSIAKRSPPGPSTALLFGHHQGSGQGGSETVAGLWPGAWHACQGCRGGGRRRRAGGGRVAGPGQRQRRGAGKLPGAVPRRVPRAPGMGRGAGCTLCTLPFALDACPLGGGGGGGATLQQFAWSEALQSFLVAPQWTIPYMM